MDSFFFSRVFSQLLGLVLTSLTIWGIARFIYFLNGQKKAVHRIVGRYIPEWVGGTSLACGLIALFWIDAKENALPYPAAPQCAAFGLLIGLALGWIHGFLRLHWAYQAVLAAKQRRRRRRMKSAPEDGNPYRPPQA